MMTALLLYTILSAVGAAAGSSATPQTEARVLRLEDEWRVAQHKNDTAALLALLAQGELAVLYCFVFLYVASRVSGRLSVDALAKNLRP